MLGPSRRRADAVYSGQSRRRPHRLAAQDTALSRRRHGFESRWGHARQGDGIPSSRPGSFADQEAPGPGRDVLDGLAQGIPAGADKLAASGVRSRRFSRPPARALKHPCRSSSGQHRRDRPLPAGLAAGRRGSHGGCQQNELGRVRFSGRSRGRIPAARPAPHGAARNPAHQRAAWSEACRTGRLSPWLHGRLRLPSASCMAFSIGDSDPACLASDPIFHRRDPFSPAAVRVRRPRFGLPWSLAAPSCRLASLSARR